MDKDKKKRSEVTWAINDDPVGKGIAMLKEGQVPLLKSLTVRCPEKEACTLEVKENEIGKSACAVYLQIIQMLTDVAGEERMREVLVGGKVKCAFEKEEYEYRLQKGAQGGAAGQVPP